MFKNMQKWAVLILIFVLAIKMLQKLDWTKHFKNICSELSSKHAKTQTSTAIILTYY